MATVLFDIGHPGHVHYFKHTIASLKQKGLNVTVLARNKDVTIELLRSLEIDFISRGKGKRSKIGKLFYMFWADLLLLKVSFLNRPVVYVSFSSPYAAQVAWLLRRPHIALNDTEHTDHMHSKFTYPFSSKILTPECYKNNLGPKQKRFNGTMEAFYLSNKVFNPDENILKELGVERSDKYAILRFVSWDAHHDYGQAGLTIDVKRAIIEILETHEIKVFISAEGDLEEEFEAFKINIEPSKIHHALSFSYLFIGESATMASESAYLGTKAIYINTLPLMGYLHLAQNFNLLKAFSNSDEVLAYLTRFLDDSDDKKTLLLQSKKMSSNFIDLNQFLESEIINNL